MFPHVPSRQAKSSLDRIMLQIKKRSNNKAYSKIDGYQTANICRPHLQACQKMVSKQAFARIKIFEVSAKNKSMVTDLMMYLHDCTDHLDLFVLDK